MTPDSSQSAASPPPAAEDANPSPPVARPDRGLWLWLGGALLLVGGGVGVWWWLRPTPPPVPTMPADVDDQEVRLALLRARQKVVDDPRSAAVWGEYGISLLAHLCYEEADRCFVETAQLEPANARWVYLRYMIATRIDPTHAFPLLRRAVELDSPAPAEQTTLRLQLADALLDRQELDEAEALYREELRLEPNNPRATYGLGMAAAARGNAELAVRLLSEARASPQARKKATAQLAALARDPAEVAEYDREADSLPADQDWPDAYFQAIAPYRVGQARERQDVSQLERLGRFEEAAEIHLRRSELEPNSPNNYATAGVDFVRAG
jgi:Flp pilus assembly protein TadD